MDKKERRTALLLFWLFFVSCYKQANVDMVKCKVLFDNAHGQTSGNADWTIHGAYSSFASAIEAEGFVVEEWGNSEANFEPEDDLPITEKALADVCVLIIPEPNVPFTTYEQRVITNFVKNGGGLLLFANHVKADRNQNGWDAIEVFNGMRYDTKISQKYHSGFVQKTFGFKFLNRNYTRLRGFRIAKHPITTGVKRITIWAGTTIFITNHSVAKPIVSLPGKQESFVVAAEVGKGRVVAIGDSSIADDGTGAPGNRLHDNWTRADNAKLLLNAVRWLAKR